MWLLSGQEAAAKSKNCTETVSHRWTRQAVLSRAQNSRSSGRRLVVAAGQLERYQAAIIGSFAPKCRSCSRSRRQHQRSAVATEIVQ